MKTKRTKPILILLICIAMAGVCLVGYYSRGHHNCILSKSYFLEKEIRDLLYLETHEPCDYRKAQDTYRDLLSKIRFDDSERNYTDRYHKALERTKLKAQAQELFEKYDLTKDTALLHKGWSLFQTKEYKALEEYNFLSFYHDRENINENWIDAQKSLNEK